VRLRKADVYGAEFVYTFADAALSYMNGGGERRYLAPLIESLGNMLLKDI
jgi:hypothetical protein